MTLLKDLIHIPEFVHKGDFVLKLAEGVLHPAETLRDYVITEQIRAAFDQALSLIKSALEGRQSKAAFLHGSFGSGKSHFMAVLHLLLGHDTGARSHPDLASIVHKHAWLQGKKFLLVPLHMIGKHSLEQAVFDQYLAHVRRLHPEAAVPAVFLGEPVLKQAELLRVTMGDESFFATLGSTGGGLRKSVEWTRARYDVARAAAPNELDRLALISAVVGNLLPTFASVVANHSEGYVAIDEGLAILSRHAKDLGYDAVLLFFDEVILWLASMVADQTFVNREGPKLSKLVEAQTSRELPIVALLARQRDLRELVGEHVPGAEKLSFFDTLKWWEGRFSTIKLEDRNLPVIVEKRLLPPKSEAARLQIDAAFAETKKLRHEIQEVLRTSSFGEEDFRRVYPFSPALVQALVAVSSVLQRERTAIKVLMQLLVEQRDTLQLGQLVPVGDLFDAIADGDEPFNEGMRITFESCKKLYRTKLRPRLCQDQGVSWEVMEGLPKSDQKRVAFTRDDRVVKTLMLAALASEVEALRSMTALKLVALNHGTYRSPIPGQESSLVLGKLRNWAAEVSELQPEGDERNPTFTLRITGVDTAVILAKAREANDKPGTRKSKLRELLFGRLGIQWTDTLDLVHEHVWRGTKRRLLIVYGNVREMVFESLRSKGDDWKLVLDFPFDEEGHEPQEDLDRVEEFRGKESNSRTVCWLPAFLSRERQTDLGTLVAIDYALANESRFYDLAAHLPPSERAQAKALLENQRNMLRARLELTVEAAYGLGKEEPGMLGAALQVSERFQCLFGGTRLLRRPEGATLGNALVGLCDQMLQLQYPKHPVFGVEVKPTVLKRVFEWVQKAARADLNRVVVDKERRAEVRGVVDPLGLGVMHEDALVVTQTWSDHFQRCAAQHGATAITVGQLRAWTDTPEPRGLPPEVQDLLILAHAELQNLRFFLHGGAVPASADRRLQDELELKPQPLPSKAAFLAAREHAAKGFGVEVGEVHGAANVGALIDGVRGVVESVLPSTRQLVTALRERLPALTLVVTEVPRGRTAMSVVSLLEALERAETNVLVDRLASHHVPTTWEAFGRSLKSAAAVASALRDTRWGTLTRALQLTGAHAGDAARLRSQLLDLLAADEEAKSVADSLRAVEAAAEELMGKAIASPPAAPLSDAPPRSHPPSPDPRPTPESPAAVDQGERWSLDAAGLAQLVQELQRKLAAGARSVSVWWRIDQTPRA